MEKTSYKKRLGSREKGALIFLPFCLAFSAAFLYLYLRQCVACVCYSDTYKSDMYAYILEMQGLDSGYSFPYPILFKLGAFFNLFLDAPNAMALATAVLQSFALAVTYYYIRKNLAGENDSLLREAGLALLTVSLFFVSMLFNPVNMDDVKIYLGTGSPNPLHNATFVAARGFAVVVFFSFCALLGGNGELRGRTRSSFRFPCFYATPQSRATRLLFSLPEAYMNFIGW